MKSSETQFAFSPIFTHNRPNVDCAEAAKALGVTDQHVRDLYDCGAFAGVDVADQSGTRRSLRLLKFTVEAWWLEKFAHEKGWEYPWENSPQITWWRKKLRELSASASASSIPVTTGKP